MMRFRLALRWSGFAFWGVAVVLMTACSTKPKGMAFMDNRIVAGNGESGFRDGKGSEARMNKPIRLAALNANTVVFADINNHAIRTVSLFGEVKTLAGGPSIEGHLDGPGSVARFSSPHGVAVRHDGVIAVAEAKGNTIRLMTPQGPSRSSYVVTTLAGVPGKSGMKDAPAREALFNAPHSVAWGARGELYVADIGNARLRMIENGVVSTVAGRAAMGKQDGDLSTGTLKYPMDIVVDDAAAVWIADAGTITVRRWRNSQGLDSPLSELKMKMPHGIALSATKVLIADLHDHLVFAMDRATGRRRDLMGAKVAGPGRLKLNEPAAVLLHAGMMWVADLGNHRIVAIQESTKSR